MSEANHLAQERRRETRIYGIYPLLIRAKNSSWQQINVHTVADNLCSGGLYFQSPQALSVGQKIFTLIQIPEGARIAARGRILRNEPQPHGLTGMAIHFSNTLLHSFAIVIRDGLRNVSPPSKHPPAS
jgi:hypothetical protein